MPKTPRRAVALTTLFFFCFSQFYQQPSVQAAVAIVNEVVLPKTFDIDIPADLGTVENAVRGTGPAILHLQTAHGNFEAQKNIQKILHVLHDRYGVDLLLLEGSAFKLNPERLRFFPKHPKENGEVNDELAKQALVKGPELFLLEEKNAAAYGIENLADYKTNGEAFKAVIRQKEKTEKFLNALNIQIERLTNPYLAPELRSFLRRLDDFETKQLPLDLRLDFLKTSAQKHLGMDLAHPVQQIEWPHLVRYFTVKKLEKELDGLRFEKERAGFLKDIKRYMSVGSRQTAVGRNIQNRLSTADRLLPTADDSSPTLIESITQLLNSPLSQKHLSTAGLLVEQLVSALPHNFPYRKYPNVMRFIAHSILGSEIRGADLMEEVTRLEQTISEALMTSDKEREIVKLLGDYRLLKKLFALELTPGDYQKIVSSRQEAVGNTAHCLLPTADCLPPTAYDHRPSELVREIQKQNSAKRVSEIDFAHLADLDELYATALKFYEDVSTRDTSMLANVERILKETGKKKAVVVTGGFHAQPFENYFTSQHYSYARISPKISNFDEKEMARGREAYVRTVLGVDQRRKTKDKRLLSKDERSHRSSVFGLRSLVSTKSTYESTWLALSHSELRQTVGDQVASDLKNRVRQIVSSYAGRHPELRSERAAHPNNSSNKSVNLTIWKSERGIQPGNTLGQLHGYSIRGTGATDHHGNDARVSLVITGHGSFGNISWTGAAAVGEWTLVNFGQDRLFEIRVNTKSFYQNPFYITVEGRQHIAKRQSEEIPPSTYEPPFGKVHVNELFRPELRAVKEFPTETFSKLLDRLLEELGFQPDPHKSDDHVFLSGDETGKSIGPRTAVIEGLHRDHKVAAFSLYYYEPDTAGHIDSFQQQHLMLTLKIEKNQPILVLERDPQVLKPGQSSGKTFEFIYRLVERVGEQLNVTTRYAGIKKRTQLRSGPLNVERPSEKSKLNSESGRQELRMDERDAFKDGLDHALVSEMANKGSEVREIRSIAEQLASVAGGKLSEGPVTKLRELETGGQKPASISRHELRASGPFTVVKEDNELVIKIDAAKAAKGHRGPSKKFPKNIVVPRRNGLVQELSSHFRILALVSQDEFHVSYSIPVHIDVHDEDYVFILNAVLARTKGMRAKFIWTTESQEPSGEIKVRVLTNEYSMDDEKLPQALADARLDIKIEKDKNNGQFRVSIPWWITARFDDTTAITRTLNTAWLTGPIQTSELRNHAERVRAIIASKERRAGSNGNGKLAVGATNSPEHLIKVWPKPPIVRIKRDAALPAGNSKSELRTELELPKTKLTEPVFLTVPEGVKVLLRYVTETPLRIDVLTGLASHNRLETIKVQNGALLSEAGRKWLPFNLNQKGPFSYDPKSSSLVLFDWAATTPLPEIRYMTADEFFANVEKSDTEQAYDLKIKPYTQIDWAKIDRGVQSILAEAPIESWETIFKTLNLDQAREMLNKGIAALDLLLDQERNLPLMAEKFTAAAKISPETVDALLRKRILAVGKLDFGSFPGGSEEEGNFWNQKAEAANAVIQDRGNLPESIWSKEDDKTWYAAFLKMFVDNYEDQYVLDHYIDDQLFAAFLYAIELAEKVLPSEKIRNIVSASVQIIVEAVEEGAKYDKNFGDLSDLLDWMLPDEKSELRRNGEDPLGVLKQVKGRDLQTAIDGTAHHLSSEASESKPLNGFLRWFVVSQYGQDKLSALEAALEPLRESAAGHFDNPEPFLNRVVWALIWHSFWSEKTADLVKTLKAFQPEFINLIKVLKENPEAYELWKSYGQGFWTISKWIKLRLVEQQNVQITAVAARAGDLASIISISDEVQASQFSGFFTFSSADKGQIDPYQMAGLDIQTVTMEKNEKNQTIRQRTAELRAARQELRAAKPSFFPKVLKSLFELISEILKFNFPSSKEPAPMKRWKLIESQSDLGTSGELLGPDGKDYSYQNTGSVINIAPHYREVNYLDVIDTVSWNMMETITLEELISGRWQVLTDITPSKAELRTKVKLELEKDGDLFNFNNETVSLTNASNFVRKLNEILESLKIPASQIFLVHRQPHQRLDHRIDIVVNSQSINVSDTDKHLEEVANALRTATASHGISDQIHYHHEVGFFENKPTIQYAGYIDHTRFGMADSLNYNLESYTQTSLPEIFFKDGATATHLTIYYGGKAFSAAAGNLYFSSEGRNHLVQQFEAALTAAGIEVENQKSEMRSKPELRTAKPALSAAQAARMGPSLQNGDRTVYLTFRNVIERLNRDFPDPANPNGPSLLKQAQDKRSIGLTGILSEVTGRNFAFSDFKRVSEARYQYFIKERVGVWLALQTNPSAELRSKPIVITSDPAITNEISGRYQEIVRGLPDNKIIPTAELRTASVSPEQKRQEELSLRLDEAEVLLNPWVGKREAVWLDIDAKMSDGPIASGTIQTKIRSLERHKDTVKVYFSDLAIDYESGTLGGFLQFLQNGRAANGRAAAAILPMNTSGVGIWIKNVRPGAFSRDLRTPGVTLVQSAIRQLLDYKVEQDRLRLQALRVLRAHADLAVPMLRDKLENLPPETYLHDAALINAALTIIASELRTSKVTRIAAEGQSSNLMKTELRTDEVSTPELDFVAPRPELRFRLSDDADSLIVKYLDMPIQPYDPNLIIAMARDYDFRSRHEKYAPSPRAWFLWGLTWAQMAKEKAIKSGIQDKTALIARDTRNIEPELIEALAAGITYAGLNVVYTAQDGPNAATSYSWSVREINPLLSIFVTSSHVADTGEVRGAKVSIKDEDGKLTSLTTREIKKEALSRIRELMKDDSKVKAERAPQSGTIQFKNIDKNTVRMSILVGKVASISSDDISLYKLARSFEEGRPALEVLDAWEKKVAKIPQAQAPLKTLKIAIDGAHTPSGYLARQTFEDLGATVISINEDVQSLSGMHNADPSKDENLTALRNAMQANGIPIGLSFDLDGDRGAIVISKKIGTFQTLPSDNVEMVLNSFWVRKGGYDPAKIGKVAVIRDVLSTEGVDFTARENGIEPLQTDAGYTFLKGRAKQLRKEAYTIPMMGERSGHAWLDVTGDYENPIAVAVVFVMNAKQYGENHASDNIFEDAVQEYSSLHKQSLRFQPPFKPALMNILKADRRYREIEEPVDPSTGKMDSRVVAIGRDITIRKAMEYFQIGKTFDTPAGVLKVHHVFTHAGEEDGLYRFADIQFEDAQEKIAGRFVLRASANDPTFVASYETKVRGEDGETLRTPARWGEMSMSGISPRPSESVQIRFVSISGLVLNWLEREGLAYIRNNKRLVKDANTRYVAESLQEFQQRMRVRRLSHRFGDNGWRGIINSWDQKSQNSSPAVRSIILNQTNEALQVIQTLNGGGRTESGKARQLGFVKKALKRLHTKLSPKSELRSETPSSEKSSNASYEPAGGSLLAAFSLLLGGVLIICVQLIMRQEVQIVRPIVSISSESVNWDLSAVDFKKPSFVKDMLRISVPFDPDHGRYFVKLNGTDKQGQVKSWQIDFQRTPTGASILSAVENLDAIATYDWQAQKSEILISRSGLKVRGFRTVTTVSKGVMGEEELRGFSQAIKNLFTPPHKTSRPELRARAKTAAGVVLLLSLIGGLIYKASNTENWNLEKKIKVTEERSASPLNEAEQLLREIVTIYQTMPADPEITGRLINLQTLFVDSGMPALDAIEKGLKPGGVIAQTNPEKSLISASLSAIMFNIAHESILQNKEGREEIVRKASGILDTFPFPEAAGRVMDDSKAAFRLLKITLGIEPQEFFTVLLQDGTSERVTRERPVTDEQITRFKKIGISAVQAGDLTVPYRAQNGSLEQAVVTLVSFFGRTDGTIAPKKMPQAELRSELNTEEVVQRLIAAINKRYGGEVDEIKLGDTWFSSEKLARFFWKNINKVVDSFKSEEEIAAAENSLASTYYDTAIAMKQNLAAGDLDQAEANLKTLILIGDGSSISQDTLWAILVKLDGRRTVDRVAILELGVLMLLDFSSKNVRTNGSKVRFKSQPKPAEHNTDPLQKIIVSQLLEDLLFPGARDELRSSVSRREISPQSFGGKNQSELQVAAERKVEPAVSKPVLVVPDEIVPAPSLMKVELLEARDRVFPVDMIQAAYRNHTPERASQVVLNNLAAVEGASGPAFVRAGLPSSLTSPDLVTPVIGRGIPVLAPNRVEGEGRERELFANVSLDAQGRSLIFREDFERLSPRAIGSWFLQAAEQQEDAKQFSGKAGKPFIAIPVSAELKNQIIEDAKKLQTNPAHHFKTDLIKALSQLTHKGQLTPDEKMQWQDVLDRLIDGQLIEFLEIGKGETAVQVANRYIAEHQNGVALVSMSARSDVHSVINLFIDNLTGPNSILAIPLAGRAVIAASGLRALINQGKTVQADDILQRVFEELDGVQVHHGSITVTNLRALAQALQRLSELRAFSVAA